MGYLTMKHLNGMQISSGCLMDYLIVVVEVATTQFEEEKSKGITIFYAIKIDQERGSKETHAHACRQPKETRV
jgi:hypothetical protein